MFSPVVLWSIVQWVHGVCALALRQDFHTVVWNKLHVSLKGDHRTHTCRRLAFLSGKRERGLFSFIPILHGMQQRGDDFSAHSHNVWCASASNNTVAWCILYTSLNSWKICHQGWEHCWLLWYCTIHLDRPAYICCSIDHNALICGSRCIVLWQHSSFAYQSIHFTCTCGLITIY